LFEEHDPSQKRGPGLLEDSEKPRLIAGISRKSVSSNIHPAGPSIKMGISMGQSLNSMGDQNQPGLMTPEGTAGTMEKGPHSPSIARVDGLEASRSRIDVKGQMARSHSIRAGLPI
jgi:hypothetical protein